MAPSLDHLAIATASIEDRRLDELLGVALSVLIIRPIIRMARSADQVSIGNMAVPEFATTGSDEIAVLATSFNRLRRSLEKAMHLLE